MRALSTQAGMCLLSRCISESPSTMASMLASLDVATLDILTRRWDDVDAVGNASSVADRGGAAVTTHDAPTPLFCRGCVTQLSHVCPHAAGAVVAPAPPQFFEALYRHVDPAEAMATFSAAKAAVGELAFDSIVARMRV